MRSAVKKMLTMRSAVKKMLTMRSSVKKIEKLKIRGRVLGTVRVVLIPAPHCAEFN